jgi:hypothetical protein
MIGARYCCRVHTLQYWVAWVALAAFNRSTTAGLAILTAPPARATFPGISSRHPGWWRHK